MKINVAYSCDEMYVQHTGISMISLFENNKHVDFIEVFFIEKQIRIESLSLLLGICEKYKRKLTIIPFQNICYDLKLKDTGRHIETIYAKLFFSRILNIDKILYLDSDTVVNGSLEELWDINLDGYQVAGVETFTVKVKSSLGLLPNDNFINDGVTLLNLKQIRKDNMIPKFIKFIDKYYGSPPLLSEGTINVVCKNKILSLHPKYNLLSGLVFYKDKRFMSSKNLSKYYSSETIDEAVRSPIVIHFLSSFYNRPWDKNCTHPYKDRYLRYKSISPWSEIPLTNNDLLYIVKFKGFILNHIPYNLYAFLRYMYIVN